MGGSEQRGGTVVLVRRALHAKVLSVDTSTADQMWLRLAGMRDVLFGFVYVPPFDSPYFSPALFGAVQERIKTAEMTTKFVILGDMNTRFGEYVRDLPRSADVQNVHFYTYPHIPDAVHNPNDNARTLATLCIDAKLLIVNNLMAPTQYFPSKLT